MKRTAKQPAVQKVAQVAQVAGRNQKGTRATRHQQLVTDVAKLRARAERALRRTERLMDAIKEFQEGAADPLAARGPRIPTRRTIGSDRG